MFAIPKSWFSLRKILLIPYFILIISGLTIPSDGGHGILSIKSLSFLATTLSLFFYILLSKKFNISQFKILCFLICSLCFFLIWACVSIVNDEILASSAIDQFKIFWLTITVVVVSIYLISENAISFVTLLKTIFFVNLTYSFSKVLLVVLHLFGLINIWALMDNLGLRFMSMQITGNLFRFQLSNDIITPYLLFFFLQSEHFGIKWSKSFRIFYLIISIFSIFLSFSRFIILVGMLAVFLHWCTLRLSTIIRALPIAITLFIIFISWIGVDNVYVIIEKRFLSSEVHVSDNTRTEQIIALLDEHDRFPLLGKGLGGYTENNIRDDRILHSYEVQWVAFLMQFGWAGILLILIPLTVIAITILSLPITRPKIALCILFLSWLFSGFTNPFLISLASGIVYSLFYLGGSTLSLLDHNKLKHCASKHPFFIATNTSLL